MIAPMSFDRRRVLRMLRGRDFECVVSAGTMQTSAALPTACGSACRGIESRLETNESDWNSFG
jgi:hypothetical protein